MLGHLKLFLENVTIADDDSDIAIDCLISIESYSYNEDADESAAGVVLDDPSSPLPVSFLTN